MAVKLRLARRGRKKLAIYDLIVADAKSPRDGRFIEKVGTYNPNSHPATIVLDDEKAFKWLMNGAQPTDTVRSILSHRGIMLRKHLQIGVNKGAITQEQADGKFEEWKQSKEARVSGEASSLAQKKSDATKARQEAEAKVSQARAEAIAKKKIVPTTDEAPADDATEAPAETPAAEGEEQA